MYKKYTISIFLFLIAEITQAAQQGAAPAQIPVNFNITAIPYENVIAREYNRLRGNQAAYTSIDQIVNQGLRGKSTEQKNQILTDLRSLKHAIATARDQAKNDGKRMWYWFYLWKDNEIVIDTLTQLENDVNEKLTALEWESQPDYVKGLWYTTKYLSVALLSIVVLSYSQKHIDKTDYDPEKGFSTLNLIKAPFYQGAETTVQSIKLILEGLSESGRFLDWLASEGIKLFPKK
ncbi:MAG: hypothetical protein ACXWL5_02395 [Candidatus Chromulinivorax sp.]